MGDYEEMKKECLDKIKAKTVSEMTPEEFFELLDTVVEINLLHHRDVQFQASRPRFFK